MRLPDYLQAERIDEPGKVSFGKRKEVGVHELLATWDFARHDGKMLRWEMFS